MTEVANYIPTDHRVTTVAHYEGVVSPGDKVDDEEGDTYATTKEEEWVSTKKTEVINTKQIETRVKRQVVLEDGKVVEDSGPQVTTNTTEDTETQEHHQTELRKLGDDPTNDQTKAVEGSKDVVDAKKWIATPNPDGVVREVKERKVISREETEEVKEIEDVQHLGDITDEDFLSAVQSGQKDLRKVLRSKEGCRTVVSTGPRVVKDTTKTNKVTDTEETRELSSVRPDGKIVTETQRTTEHEEVDDRELPSQEADVNTHKESSQRYFKAREQEDVDYYADGVKFAHEMRFKAETTEGERRGEGLDDPDWDSLSARARRRSNQQRPAQRYRDGIALGASPLDRKDALTKRPLDFDQEEETRKVETSKWLENHFGSESRSSKDSIDDDVDEVEREHPPKTSFFNVTIKSTPTPTSTRMEASPCSGLESPSLKYVAPSRGYVQHVEAERDRQVSGSGGGYFKGISDWSERRVEMQKRYEPSGKSRSSPLPDYREYRRKSPSPDYRARTSPILDRVGTPTPPQRKRAVERRQRASQESRYDSGYRTPSRTDIRDEPLEEPPPDYSPPSPPPALVHDKKAYQKTRFAADTPTKDGVKEAPMKQKSGNIIGQSIRKLVGKIRSASAERKARQRAKRSPSPSYQAGHQIDRDLPPQHSAMEKPVQRYYLGEDPFAGSIYGRENKYDGVKPVRGSRKHREHHHNGRTEYHEERSQSTLGRFGKSSSTTSRDQRVSQTLPRHSTKYEQPTRLEKGDRSNSTINVSIINNVKQPPAKPARTYKSNLARSKSFNVEANMYRSNPHLPPRLNDAPTGLKSPGLISSLSRSQRDLHENGDTHRFQSRNGSGDVQKVFMKDLKSRAPELFRTLHENDDDVYRTTSILKSSSRYGGDIYEPPTRLRDTFATSTPMSKSPPLRRGSNSSDNYSETYHTTSRSDDPNRPSVTNTMQSFSKKTLPSKDGRSVETIESTETRSVTKSHSRNYYDSDASRYGSVSPVVIEVRNYSRK